MTGVRVAVVDDHRMLLPGLRTALLERDLDVAATAESVDDLPPGAFDAVLCDLHLRRGPSGARAVHALVASGSVVLAMSGVASRDSVLDAIEAGASGFVHKSLEIDEVADAAWAVLTDGVHMSAALAGFLLVDFRLRPLPDGELYGRRLAVLRGRAQGDTVEEIARTQRVRRTAVVADLISALETGRRRRRRLRPTTAELAVMWRIRCRGMANPQIAADLMISTDTVISHLKNIRRRYEELYPQYRRSDRQLRDVANLWAAELDLCWEDGPDPT